MALAQLNVVVGDMEAGDTPLFGDVVRYELLCRRHYLGGDTGVTVG